MIAVDRVSKHYGRFQAVRDLSFRVEAGQCVGLLGANGAGKTTTIRMITGYHAPTTGSIAVDGLDSIEDSQEVRRRIGYLPESTPLYPEMRVDSFLDHRARLYGLDRSARRTGVARAMERCHLTDVRRRRIGQLSKGYRQRVGLASALVHDPPILVLDEPSSGLDPTQIRETRSLIRDLAASRTVLVSSHILPEVERTCDRVLVIARGRLVADGTPAELVQRHASGATRAHADVRTPDAERAAAALTSAGLRLAPSDPTPDGWTRLWFSADTDPRERAAVALASAGVLARELAGQTASLEQVFIALMEAGEPAPNAPPTGSAAA
jgi:ABC-2 type transport system ATP-binding protein